MSKLTKKKYKEELSHVIPSAEMAVLQPLRAAVLQAFEDDSLIDFADSDPLVWESIKTTFSKLPLSTKLFRIFVLQSKYGTLDLSEEDEPRDKVPRLEGIPAYFQPTIKTTISKAPRKNESNIFDQSVRSNGCVTPFPEIQSRPDADRPLKIRNSDGLEYIVKRCTCDFHFGALAECECVSDEYLVPSQILKARLRNNEWELLAQWRPSPNGSVPTENWIPRWPLSLWSEKCYMRFIEARARQS